jgi:hypothetical protein
MGGRGGKVDQNESETRGVRRWQAINRSNGNVNISNINNETNKSRAVDELVNSYLECYYFPRISKKGKDR